jgi:hypothetical protein
LLPERRRLSSLHTSHTEYAAASNNDNLRSAQIIYHEQAFIVRTAATTGSSIGRIYTTAK